jgi:hypothetical protein
MVRALALLLCLCGSAYGQEVSRGCDKAVGFKHVVATGPVELIPAVPGQSIYFCGFTIVQKGNTLDLIVMIGQGQNCATNRKDLTPQMSLPADFALSTRIPASPPMPGSEGYALCIQTIGTTGALTGLVFYTQF